MIQANEMSAVISDHDGDDSLMKAMSSTSRGPGMRGVQFPWKLHAILNDPNISVQDIIGWMPSGKSFRVFSKDAFEKTVMPTYFTTSSYGSFQRSLNLWGFRVVSKGDHRGEVYHEHFQRGRPELCNRMTRTKKKQEEVLKDGGAHTATGAKQPGTRPPMSLVSPFLERARHDLHTPALASMMLTSTPLETVSCAINLVRKSQADQTSCPPPPMDQGFGARFQDAGRPLPPVIGDHFLLLAAEEVLLLRHQQLKERLSRRHSIMETLASSLSQRRRSFGEA